MIRTTILRLIKWQVQVKGLKCFSHDHEIVLVVCRTLHPLGLTLCSTYIVHWKILLWLFSSCCKRQCHYQRYHSSQSQGLHRHTGKRAVTPVYCHSSRIISWVPWQLISRPWQPISRPPSALWLAGTREIPVSKLNTTKCKLLMMPTCTPSFFFFLFCSLSTESSSVLSGRSHDLTAHHQEHPILGKTSSGPPALDMARVGSGNMPISSSLPPSSRIDSLPSTREASSTQMELPSSRIEPPSASQVCYCALPLGLSWLFY